jgi:serine/threonine-protein kinase HipA
MTRRFDRDADGGKIHVQSLCALAHYDFNAAGEYSYEQALSLIQRLNLGYPALAEMYRRMVFNMVARNQDDHTRNIAFLMDSNGTWRLAPAFDVVWAYNSKGSWTNRHQMTVNGKRDHFERGDLLAVSENFGVKGAAEIVNQVTGAVAAWGSIARECGVDSALLKKIATTHRTTLAGK